MSDTGLGKEYEGMTRRCRVTIRTGTVYNNCGLFSLSGQFSRISFKAEERIPSASVGTSAGSKEDNEKMSKTNDEVVIDRFVCNPSF